MQSYIDVYSRFFMFLCFWGVFGCVKRVRVLTSRAVRVLKQLRQKMIVRPKMQRQSTSLAISYHVIATEEQIYSNH